MKSVITFIFVFISLSLCVSCNQQTRQGSPATTPPEVTTVVTYSIAFMPTFTPAPGNTPKEGQQTAVANSRATKTAKATIPAPTSTLTPSKNSQPTAITTRILIPTNTPTFDVAKIVARTPALPAQCPIENPNLVPAIDTWNSQVGYRVLLPEPILDFLNSGGTLPSVVSAFSKEYSSRIPTPAIQKDMTGDGINELIITNDKTVLVFGCNSGEYKTLLQYNGENGWVRFVRFEIHGDMNLDGVPELIINEQHGTTNVDHNVTIFEWDGYEFKSIIQGTDSYSGEPIFVAVMSGATGISIRDVDQNGTRELILSGNMPLIGTSSYIAGVPWRDETHVYTWNGTLFVLYRIEFSAPEYRFQAIQDGDRATLVGEYTHALDFYQQAAFSDKLDWWSDERWGYEVMLFASIGDETPTPMPTPRPDPTDYYNLSAYARFRIMLLHVTRGFLPEAEIVFTTLKDKYPQGQPGYAYVEMATAFWDEYKASFNLTQACDRAIEYATLHPSEILSYLGNGEYARTYYGNQSLEYTPDDICPFR